MRLLGLCLLFIISCFMLTGCLDVVEEIDLKSDGAGRIKATLNLSKSRTKVASLMKLEKIDGMKIPSKQEVQQHLSTIVRLLKQSDGISNVNSTLDFERYIATVSCDFSDVQALNSFSKTLSNHFKTQLANYSVYNYDRKNKTFARKYMYSPDARKTFSKLTAENRSAFDDAFFTSIYRFPTAVSNQQNKAGKLSPNRKAVMMRVGFLDLINGKADLSNSIVLNH